MGDGQKGGKQGGISMPQLNLGKLKQDPASPDNLDEAQPDDWQRTLGPRDLKKIK